MSNRKSQIANLKLVFAILAALGVSFILQNFFLANSPRINTKYLDSLFAAKPTATPTPTLAVTPLPTYSVQPFNFLTPEPSPTLTQTEFVSQNPTSVPQPSTIPQPTIPTPTVTTPPTFTVCPTTSSQNYTSLGAERSSADIPINGPVENNPEINLRLRGFTPVNQGTSLISRNGNNYGLDNQMPPQISSLYGGPLPQIIKTYQIFEWDFQNNKSAAPQVATPNYPVHMLGLAASPGQKLLGLKAGRDIGGGHVFMVLYATPTDITFTHSNSDSLLGGYLFYFLDICVDPNLLALYQKDNASGRGSLPVISTGQVFGTAQSNEVKIVVRDTMSFMDTRYKEDW